VADTIHAVVPVASAMAAVHRHLARLWSSDAGAVLVHAGGLALMSGGRASSAPSGMVRRR
jgi:hypothetical protein